MKHSENNDTLYGFTRARRCSALLCSAQLSGGDLHQFHGLAVAIGRQTPHGFESALVSDVSGANVAALSVVVCVTALNTCCVVELTFQKQRFNNWKKLSTQNKMSG